MNRFGKNGQLYLVPDFSGIDLSFFPFNWMLVVGLLYIAYIMFRYSPCTADVSKTFILKGCWMLSNAFPASNDMIMCFFPFSLFI